MQLPVASLSGDSINALLRIRIHDALFLQLLSSPLSRAAGFIRIALQKPCIEPRCTAAEGCHPRVCECVQPPEIELMSSTGSWLIVVYDPRRLVARTLG